MVSSLTDAPCPLFHPRVPSPPSLFSGLVLQLNVRKAREHIDEPLLAEPSHFNLSLRVVAQVGAEFSKGLVLSLHVFGDEVAVRDSVAFREVMDNNDFALDGRDRAQKVRMRGVWIDMFMPIFKHRFFKRCGFTCVALAITCAATTLTVTAVSSGESRSTPRVAQHSPRSAESDDTAPVRKGVLKVLTLNVAHGRSDGRNQALQRTKTIRSNLDDVAKLLARVRPDVAALQEADGPSIWSGGFSHVEYLASNAGFEFSSHGLHVDGAKISFGTALLSCRLLKDALSITFESSPPTFSKGFLVSAVAWPSEPETLVDVVTVHLDFSRRSVRREQVAQMASELKPRKRPLIILGDFNCDWKRENSALRVLARELNLVAHKPDANDLITFPKLRTRLDWILISGEFRFIKYEVLSDEPVSDHFAVVAEIELKEKD